MKDIHNQIGMAFVKALAENEDRIMQSMVGDTINDTLAIMPHHSIIDNDDSTPVVTRSTCQREMVRDYVKERMYSDGFAYWRTTGRLVVTWDNGNITYILYTEIKHTLFVIDCGYDENVPF